MTNLSVPLSFSAQEAVPRRGEPVTVGLPWPRGAISDDAHFALIGPDGTSQILQTEVLDRWPDGSVRWCLFDFLATWDGNNPNADYRIEINESPRSSPEISINRENYHAINILLDIDENTIFNYDWLIDAGSVQRANALIRNRCMLLSLDLGTMQIYGVADRIIDDVYRIYFTIVNHSASEHLAGNWDLGNQGSVFFRRLTLSMDFHNVINVRVAVSECRNAKPQTPVAFSLKQHSSGGENWQSNNHIDSTRKVPRHAGATVSIAGNSSNNSGLRLIPIASITSNISHVALAIPHFWENFPLGMGATEQAISLDLLPSADHHHELQGGEQKTWSIVAAFRNDNITDQPLVWARSPITVTAPPEWYARCGVVPYLTPKESDPHRTYLALVDQAIEGPDTFYHKREKIDEYGWRHFGDIWADHEAVFHPGPEPMVSHYNNQYDCVAGFLIQYLRSGDVRWLRFGLECADHTCDIDVYHTTKDKSAYNGGLFWHTYHYAPADTGTHRSYPKSLRTGKLFDGGQDLEKMGATGATLKKNYAIGGGPSAAHNYNYGLMLAYFLTGKPMYKETAIGLADFVLNMDDGNRTVFRWLSRKETGLSIQSSEGYLGPGRASANSLLAVLVGHQLTGEEKYLKKAEWIIRNVVHPKQNLESLDLLNAELRWFYVMFLQSLGKYLDYKIVLDQLDQNYDYARLCLLHYVKWMAEHERPILNEPEKLQYPTETWAAQDLRKVDVFQFAAKHSTGAEREKYLERAEWFFQYCVTTLDKFPTKSLCRPVVLCMNHGWSRAWWKQNPEASAPPPRDSINIENLGEWKMYEPQKAVALRRAKTIIKVGAAVFVISLIAVLAYLFS